MSANPNPQRGARSVKEHAGGCAPSSSRQCEAELQGIDPGRALPRSRGRRTGARPAVQDPHVPTDNEEPAHGKTSHVRAMSIHPATK
jgi:hypothetical protein